jgi:hypothetical protein
MRVSKPRVSRERASSQLTSGGADRAQATKKRGGPQYWAKLGWTTGRRRKKRMKVVAPPAASLASSL